MRRLFSRIVLFCALAVAMHPGTAQEGEGVSDKLVLLGASYVHSWGEPDLGYGTVVNRGIGGDVTSGMLERFDRDVLAERPSTVLIWGHINNIHRAPGDRMEEAKEGIRADYREMISRARANGIDVIIATEVTLSEAVGWINQLRAFVGGLLGKKGYAAHVNVHVHDVNTWLVAHAREQGLRLLDFEAALNDDDGFRRVEFTSEDGTHVSEAGYAELTRFARSELAR